MQNGFIERFNRTFREDVLDTYWFEDLEQLGIIAEKWRYDYKFYHPHKTLEYKAPCQYASRYSKDLDPWKEEENENMSWSRKLGQRFRNFKLRNYEKDQTRIQFGIQS